jgi:hypothetical protein
VSQSPQTTDRVSLDLAHELVELLSEAGVEIFNAYGPGNVVLMRLAVMRERIQKASLTNLQEIDHARS